MLSRWLIKVSVICCLSLTSVAQIEVQKNNEMQKTEEDEKVILFPIVYYTPETSLSAGILSIFNFDKVREGKISNLQLIYAYTLKDQAIALIRPKLYFDEGKKDISAEFYYSFNPSEYYGKLGNHLDEAELYVENTFTSTVSGAHNFYGDFFGRIGVIKELRKILNTDSQGILRNELQGGFENVDVSGVFVGVEWDTRDYPNSPLNGYFHRITATRFQTLDRESNDKLKNFERYEAESRFYFSFDQNKVYATQVALTQVTQDKIPFQNLVLIGGNENMRGYYGGEWRDLNLLMWQNEIRVPYNDRFGWATFVSLAKLDHEMSRIGGSDLKYSFGGGGYYLLDPQGRTKIKLDMGISKDNSGVYFVLGESF